MLIIERNDLVRRQRRDEMRAKIVHVEKETATRRVFDVRIDERIDLNEAAGIVDNRQIELDKRKRYAVDTHR
jgi:hypothetical protein